MTDILAFDRQPVTFRTFDEDGMLRVDPVNITKAAVNHYRGSEINGYQELGLDPNALYGLLRPAEELEKAASTFNGRQVMSRHVKVTAANHHGEHTAGALGSNTRFEAPFLVSSITLWRQADIDLVLSKKKCELSCGYKYKVRMEKGTYEGTPYDGIMYDIRGNHIALVKAGRAGPECYVTDSAEEATLSYKTYAVAVHKAIAEGRLALDASPEDVEAVCKDAESSVPPALRKEDDKEAKAKADKEAKDKADKEAKDKADMEAKNKADKEAKDKADKEAMDAMATSIRSQVMREAAQAVAARNLVRPLVGDIMGMDEAPASDILSYALKERGVSVPSGTSVDAMNVMVSMALDSARPKRAPAKPEKIALDAASGADIMSRFGISSVPVTTGVGE